MSDFDEKDIISTSPGSDFDDADLIDVDESKKPKISQAKSLQKGLEQGVTLSSGDEIQGVLGAGMDAGQALLNKLGLMSPSPSQVDADLASQGFKGDLQPSVLDQYRSARDLARKEYDQAQQANPGTFLAGNIAGGALTLPAMPAVASGTGIGAGMANAAIPSALLGSGMSEADLTQGNVGQAAKDVLKDTAIGVGTAGALPLVGQALKGAGKAIGNTQTMQDIIEAYKVGKQNINLAAPDFLLQGRDTVKNAAGKAVDEIGSKIQKIFKQKKSVLDDLEASGVTKETKDILQGLADKVNSTTALRDEESAMLNKVLEKQFSQKNSARTPIELENLLKDLNDLKANVQTPSGRNAVDYAVNQVKALQNDLSPELANLNNQAFKTIESGEMLAGRNPLDYLGAKADQATKEKVANLIEKASSDYKAQSSLQDILAKGGQTSKNVEIGGLKDLVPEAAKAIEDVKPLANQMRIAKDVQSPSFKGNGGLLSEATSAIKNNTTNIANKAGMAAKRSQDLLTKGIDKLANADGNQLQQLSARMIEIGGKTGQEFANVLNQIPNKSQTSKNAIIFGLMQRPEFRNMFHKVNGDTEFDVEDSE